MNQISIALIFTFGLFFGMLTLLEVGRRIGSRRLANDPEGARAGTGAVGRRGRSDGAEEKP